MNTASPTKFRSFLLLSIPLLQLLSPCQAWAQHQQLRWIQNDNRINFHVKTNRLEPVFQENTTDFLTRYFDLPDGDMLIADNRLTDANGEEHVRFKHLHRGHEIIGSDIIGHYKDDRLTSFNGVVFFPSDITVRVDEQSALDS
ncbi:MAG: hypothetical protein JJ975_13445, partial [Bacteroidia bacterium]|nr:hypothetical protein [Bacteroidia bacterium]